MTVTTAASRPPKDRRVVVHTDNGGTATMHGHTIRAAREAANMTQDRLAEAAGLSKRTVLRAEAGKPMSKETASALSSVLRLDLSPPREPSAPALPADPLLAEILSRGETVRWEGRPDRKAWERINLPHLWYALHHAAAAAFTMVPVYAWLLDRSLVEGVWTGVGLAAVGMGTSGCLGVRAARAVGVHRRKLALMDRTRLVATDAALYQEVLETAGGSVTVLRTPIGRRTRIEEKAAYLLWPRARVVEVGDREGDRGDLATRHVVGVPGLDKVLEGIRKGEGAR